MTLNFTKMHGCGNDYIFLPPEQSDIPNPSELSRTLSGRRFSVGSDGLVLITGDRTCGFGMRIFNSDGSEGATCGNALRCAALFLLRRGYADVPEFEINTASGSRRVTVEDNGRVAVGMGKASLIADRSGLPMINRPVFAGGVRYRMTAISVGNPHQVIFVSDPAAVPLEKIGGELEHSLPGGINTEFVKMTGKSSMIMRVYERGSGETLSCGSGASAAAAVAVMSGRADPDTPVEVTLPGGKLSVTVSGELDITLTGSAVFVYDGRLEI